MLVLTRGKDQSTDIMTPDGYHIRVIVVEIRGGRIRLGFEAVKEVQINRSEVQEEKGQSDVADDVSSVDSPAVQHDAVADQDPAVPAFRTQGDVRLRTKLGRSRPAN